MTSDAGSVLKAKKLNEANFHALKHGLSSRLSGKSLKIASNKTSLNVNLLRFRIGGDAKIWQWPV